MYILYHLGGKTTILKLTCSWKKNDSLLWNNNLIDGKLAALCQILLFVDVLCLLYMCALLIARIRLWSHIPHPMYRVNEKWQVHWSTPCTWPDQCLSGMGVTVLLTARSAYILRTLEACIIYCREMIKISFNLIAVILIIVNAAIMYLLLYTLIHISNGYRSTI